jgi:RNA polymerase sigma factor FliA
LTEQEELETWHLFKKDGRGEERDRLIDHYLPLVRRIAERACYSLAHHVCVEDLFSSGLCGLLDAMDRYTPSRNIKFSTFASLRIRGAMLDDVRSNDWVPRVARQAFQLFYGARQELIQRYQREPDDEEMRCYLNCDVEAYTKLCQEVNLTQMSSFQALGSGLDHEGEEPAFEFPDHRDTKSRHLEELRECLKIAIDSLPEKKKAALIMYYHEEMTLKEISKVLGVSEGRVSQILSEVVAHLKAHHLKDLNSFIKA